MLLNRDRSKTMQINYQPQHFSINGKDITNNNSKNLDNENYLLKRIKDVEGKFQLIIKD